MNNSAKKWLWALVAVLVAVLIALAILLAGALRPGDRDAVLSAGFHAPEQEPQPQEETAPQGEKMPETESIITGTAEDNMAIETPVCTLYYPREWESLLRVEMTDGEPYSAAFWAELPSEVSAPLFTVSFGEESESVLGYLTAEDGQRLAVSLEKHELVPDETWMEEDIFILQAMQAASRVVESNLPALEPAGAEEPFALPENDGTLMTVETPWAALFYPACWEKYLTAETDETACTVTFLANVGERESVELFVLCFGGEEGMPAGTVSTPEGDVELLVRMGSLSFDDSWSENEKNIVYAMQEGINDLLAALA